MNGTVLRGQERPASSHRRGKAGAGWVVAVPAVAAFAVMLIGLTGSSYWRDESATVTAASMPFPQLLRMLGHVDAVHGLFYSVEWCVAHVLGTSEVALRLPSAVAVGCAALGIAVIGRRLASDRAGVLAGLVFAALPTVSSVGQEARSNAMVMAAAVLASYQLLRVVREPGRRQLAAYALAVALLGYLNLVSLLLVAAHGVTVGLAGRRETRRRLAGGWLAAVVAGIAATTPVLVFGWRERAQIDWIPVPGAATVQSLLTTLTMGTVASVAVISILATLGASGAANRPVGGRRPAAAGDASAAAVSPLGLLCVPWLVVPPVLAFIAAQGQVHIFGYIYLLLLPAAALLSGAGLARLPALGQLAALALVVILALPGQIGDRRPAGHGDDIRDAALFLQQHARSTDAAIYGGGPAGGLVPDWAYAYPYGFTKPVNIGFKAPAAAIANLFGAAVPPVVLERRLRAYSRVWVVELARDTPDTPEVPAGQFRLAGTWQISDIWLRLYQRDHQPPETHRTEATFPRHVHLFRGPKSS